MKPRHRLIQIALTLLSTLLILLLWGTAVAQNSQNLEKDIVRFGGDVTIAEEQMVHNATAIAGSVIVLNNGQVRGDAVAIGGDVILKTGARVNGDATAIGGDIFREDNVTIGGDAVAVLSGDRGLMLRMRQWGLSGLLIRAYWVSAAAHTMIVLTLTAIGVLLVFLIPHFLQSVVSTLNQAPLKSGVWGLGSVVALILLSALISGSLLGLVLLPIANLAIFVAGLLGSIGIALWLGQRTLPVAGRPLWQSLVIGMLILGVIGLIPILGGLFFLVANLFGLGGILVSQFSKHQREWLRHQPPPPRLEQTDQHPQEMP